MFEPKSQHICAIHEDDSRSFLPVVAPIASPWEKTKRFLRKLILVTEMNPQSIMFFKNPARIIDERKQQVDSESWVIHPFSILRLYYEIYLTFGYFLCFIFIPMDASYAYLLPTYDMGVVDDICCIIALTDIFMNFNTGYVISTETILMKRKKIAKRYMLSLFFITDVLSVLPELHNFVKNPTVVDVFNYCGMMRIVRLLTFVEYLDRTLNYFNLGGFKSLFIRVLCVAMILGHYLSCLMFFFKLIYEHITEGFHANQTSRIIQDRRNFSGDESDYTIHTYLKYFFESSSYLLGVDFKFRWHEPWITYVMGIVEYFGGKILSTFMIVIFVDIFKSSYYLEVKYYAMMNQVDSFMTAYQFPISLQKKIHTFYSYKYGKKYVNQTKIEQFLSGKLKKEIRYHECRKLVQDLHFFDQFPRNILEDILNALKVELFMTNDLIIKAGTPGDCMYFISSGTVAVITPQGKEVCHLEDGDYFGEVCLISPKLKRTATIIALEICELYRVDTKTFKTFFEVHRLLYEEIYQEAKRRYKHTKDIDSTSLNLKRNE